MATGSSDVDLKHKITNVSDANFPRDPEGRVYHLGTKPGEGESLLWL